MEPYKKGIIQYFFFHVVCFSIACRGALTASETRADRVIFWFKVALTSIKFLDRETSQPVNV